MAKILVTCAGSGIGQSAIDSLLLSRKHIIVGCDNNRNVYANHFCNQFFVAPEIYSDNYLEFVLNLCLKENIDLVIPGHDHELLLFSRHISHFHEKGVEVIVSQPDLIEISRDKYMWYKYFNSHGCAIVPTYRINEFKKNPDSNILPAIVKPVGGSSSQGIRIINSLSELENVPENDIIQPYLFPTKGDSNYDIIEKTVKNGKFIQMSEISIQLIFSKKSEFSGIFISKNVLKNGIPIHVDPIQPDSFEYFDDIMKFVPICLKQSVKGPVNIQGRITDKGLVFFEMNMRFTGITGNRAQLGFNEVDFLVDDFLGFPTSKFGGYAVNKYGVRQVACTTIMKESSCMNEIKTFCILCKTETINNVKEFVENTNNSKYLLICQDECLEEYKKIFQETKSIIIICEKDKSTESAYGQCDALISFIGRDHSYSQGQIYDDILYMHRQFNRIIRVKVPYVIQFVLSETYSKDFSTSNFQKMFNQELLDSIKQYSPSTKVGLFQLSTNNNTELYDRILSSFLS